MSPPSDLIVPLVRVSIALSALAASPIWTELLSGTETPFGSTHIVRAPCPGMVGPTTIIAFRFAELTALILNTLSLVKVYDVPLLGERMTNIAIDRGVVGFLDPDPLAGQEIDEPQSRVVVSIVSVEIPKV